MILWNQHKDFSPEFLARHHDLVLYHVFHYIKAFVLFPPNCSCKDLCQCHDLRAKAVLSLNMDLYHKVTEEKEDPALLRAMKFLFEIPGSSFFERHYTKAYPSWLIEQELQKREDENHFRIVNRLVWMLLRLAKTYEVSPFGEPEASLKKAIEHILGKNPLKRKASQKIHYLGGEKAYLARFNEYQAVLPFIAALAYVKKGKFITNLNKTSQIETFLKTAHWLRKKLLRLKTPNIKQGTMFLETTFLPLPSWINSDDIKIPLEPFQEILDDIDANTEGPFEPGKKNKT